MFDLKAEVKNVMQGADEAAWKKERLGFLTASNAEKACARLRNGKPGAQYEALIWQLIAERATGIPTDFYVTPEMQWGTDHEEAAAEAFEAETGKLVSGNGKIFIKHPEIAWLGASPDRFVGDDALLEIKCPTTVRHLQRVFSREIPPEYRRQMQVQLLCTGRKFCYFADFDPRLKGGVLDKAALLILEYRPTDLELEETLKLCREFLDDLQNRIETLNAA